MENIATEILIIGSGGAGLRLAIELFEKGQKNILVVGDCGFSDAHTKMAEGGINAAFGNMDNEADTPFIHAADTFLEGQEIANPHIVEALAKYAPSTIEDLIRMGADFHREENGKISQRYFGAHTYRRTIFRGDQTGQEILKVLCKTFQKYKIPNIDRLYIMKLIKKGDRVVGAIGIKDEKVFFIEAKIIVLATAGYANIYSRSSSRPFEGYGDGIAMAIEAGAVVGDMEMVQFHPTGLIYPKEVAGELVTEAVRGEGGILTDLQGERFMKKYSPQKMELSTRDVVARSVYMEIMAGRGTDRGGVYLDVSKRNKKDILERLPKMYALLKKYNNVDISKSAMEVAPTAHYTMGGIRFDEKNFHIGVEGLYAVGECTLGVHGANRLGGNSLAEVLVFGKLMGEYLAGKKILKTPSYTGDSKSTEKYVEKTFLSEGKLDTKETISILKNMLWEHVGIIRSKQSINKGLSKLRLKGEKVRKYGLSNLESKASSIIWKNRVKTILELGELVMLGGLERQESRGAHYREDYPKKDKKFLKNFLFQIVNGKIRLTSQPISKPSKEFEDILVNFKKTHNYGHVE